MTMPPYSAFLQTGCVWPVHRAAGRTRGARGQSMSLGGPVGIGKHPRPDDPIGVLGNLPFITPAWAKSCDFFDLNYIGLLCAKKHPRVCGRRATVATIRPPAELAPSRAQQASWQVSELRIAPSLP